MTQPTRASRLATAKSVDVYLRPRGTQILAPATMASHNPLHKLVLTREMGRALWNPDSKFDIIWGDLTLTPDEARSIFERDGLSPARDPAPDPQPLSQILIADDVEDRPLLSRETLVGYNEALDKAIEGLSKQGCKVFFGGTEVTEPQPSDPSHPDRLQNALDRINANHKAALQALADTSPISGPGPSPCDLLDESFEKLPDHIKLRCRACRGPKTPVNFGRSTQKADGDWFPLQGRLTLEQVEQLQDAAFRPERTSLGLIAVARKLEDWGVTVV